MVVAKLEEFGSLAGIGRQAPNAGGEVPALELHLLAGRIEDDQGCVRLFLAGRRGVVGQSQRDNSETQPGTRAHDSFSPQSRRSVSRFMIAGRGWLSAPTRKRSARRLDGGGAWAYIVERKG